VRQGLSASDEFDLRHEVYVMQMPQSGERITGRDRIPGPPPPITGVDNLPLQLGTGLCAIRSTQMPA
jgi:hypothetical protein